MKNAVTVQADGTIYLHVHDEGFQKSREFVERFAYLREDGNGEHVKIYGVSKDSVRGSLVYGHNPNQLLSDLEALASTDIPPTITDLFHDTNRVKERGLEIVSENGEFIVRAKDRGLINELWGEIEGNYQAERIDENSFSIQPKYSRRVVERFAIHGIHNTIGDLPAESYREAEREYKLSYKILMDLPGIRKIGNYLTIGEVNAEIVSSFEEKVKRQLKNCGAVLPPNYREALEARFERDENPESLNRLNHPIKHLAKIDSLNLESSPEKRQDHDGIGGVILGWTMEEKLALKKSLGFTYMSISDAAEEYGIDESEFYEGELSGFVGYSNCVRVSEELTDAVVELETRRFEDSEVEQDVYEHGGY